MAFAEHWQAYPWEVLDVPVVWLHWTIGRIEGRGAVAKYREFQAQVDRATQAALGRGR